MKEYVIVRTVVISIEVCTRASWLMVLDSGLKSSSVILSVSAAIDSD